MALFVVERYLGDETETKAKDNNDHLSNLISKIELRKKLNTTNSILDKSDDKLNIRTSNKHLVKKKTSKSKEEVEDTKEISNVQEQITFVNEEAQGEEHHSMKQKKRKRKKDIEINDSFIKSSKEEKDVEEPSFKLKKNKIQKKSDIDKEVDRSYLTSDNENKNREGDLFLQTEENVSKKHKKKKKKNVNSSLSTQDISDIAMDASDELLQTSDLAKETEEIGITDCFKEPKNNFTVIGDHSFNKNKQVRCVLPQWLAKPSVISVDLKNLKNDIHSIPYLNKTLINKLQENGITHFFPVQSQLIPFLLKSERTRSSYIWPVDVCVSAPTGSGKTLAFVLPIVQTLLTRLVSELRVIVILPVQDLAAQVASVFRKYIKGTGLSVYLTVGGTPLHEEQQHLVKQKVDGTFERLVDILVTTPGRLVDHIYSTPGFTLKHLRFIVIDEADRVMDNFQNDWLYHVDNHLSVRGCPPLTVANLQSMPIRPQKLLFSATLSSDPEKLSELSLFQPHLFTSVVSSTNKEVNDNKFIGKYTTPAELKECMVVCDRTVKPLILFQLIVREKWNHILVFASTTQNVRNLATLLRIFGSKTQHCLKVAEINAALPRIKRQQLIESFTAGVVDVLVSTDSLARGIDIPGVRYVINYDIPKFIKSYIHRIGRTGRAGQEGTAVSLLTHEQVERFTNLLKTADKHDIEELKVSEEELEDFEEMYKDALLSLKEISEEQQKRQEEEKMLNNKIAIGRMKSAQTTGLKLKGVKNKHRTKKGKIK